MAKQSRTGARGKITITSRLCKTCEFCVDICPKDCLIISEESGRLEFVNVEECNACAACAKICPDIAIRVWRIDEDAQKQVKPAPEPLKFNVQPPPEAALELKDGEELFIASNEAVGYGAILAGCKHFFGYPITPQNEVTEFFSREMEKYGGIFVQTESELSSINAVLGASAAGVRAMTSTASPGFSLMGEALSAMASMGYPAVVVNVQRGGPGMGHTQTAQMDYLQATRGGGHGGYKCIVLAPDSAQETIEIIQLAFHLADKYRIVSLVLLDALLGQMSEKVHLKKIEFNEELPEKKWALRGYETMHPTGRHLSTMGFIGFGSYTGFLGRMEKIWKDVKENEIRYEEYDTEDADVLLIAYGSSSRVARDAAVAARGEGIKVGVFRPITLWPFPYERVNQLTKKAKKVIVVEDSLGQLIEDVRLASGYGAEIALVGAMSRHIAGHGGIIYPEKVIEEIKKSNAVKA